MAYFPCHSNIVNEYWIKGKIEWYCGSIFSYHCQISPIFSLCMLESHLTRFSEISCASFTSNRVLYFSQDFSTCHLSKIHLQSERSGFTWSKTFYFLFEETWNIYSEKKELFLKSSCFLLFRNTYLKKYHWVAGFICFNRVASQKCKNTTPQTNLKRVLISWRKHLFNSK